MSEVASNTGKKGNSKKIISVAIIAVAIGVAPYITGKIVQQRFEHKIALLNAKLAPFSHQKETIKLEYKSGWFSSSAKTTIGNVVINHHITHGPYCTFGIASIDSKFELPKKANDTLNGLFEGKAPYTIITKLNFLNTTELTVTSPNIGQKIAPDSPNVNITWEGLNYSATISKNTVSSSLSIPKFVFNQKDSGTFSIENIKSHGTADRLLDKNLNINLPKEFNINGSGSIDKIAFKFSDGGNQGDLQLNNLTTQVVSTQDNSYTSDFTIDNIKLTSDEAIFSTGKINFNSSAKDPLWALRDNLVDADWNSSTTGSINNISLSALQENIKAFLDFSYKQQLTDNKTTVGFSESYSAKNINLQIPNSDNLANTAEFGYNLDGLPKKELSTVVEGYINQFIVALNSINDSSDAALSAYMQSSQAFQKDAERFAVATLQGTPSFTIDAKTTGDKGNADINFKAALVKPDNSTNNPQALVMQAQNRVSSTLSVNIAEPLIDAMAKIKGISEDDLADFKQELANRLHFINNNGNYTLNIEFKDSLFYVNGQVDPEFLQRSSQSFR